MTSSLNRIRRPGRGAFEPASSRDDSDDTGSDDYHVRQEESLAGNPDNAPPDILHKIPRLFRFDNDAPEATGLAIDIFARATILMSSIFLGPALLELASQAVEDECSLIPNTNTNMTEACIENGRIYGFRPSSVLTNIAIVAGVLGSVTMPYFGALTDHTPFRWQIGALSAAGLVLVKGTETMVSSKTWLIIACLQVISALLFNMHITTTYAYTSELSEDSVLQTGYNVYYFVVMYISTLIFLVFVTAMSLILETDDVGTARISQITTTSVSACLFYVSWKHLFRHRPALSSVPDGQSLMSSGFRKVIGTFLRIGKELPALKWLTFAIMFGESATGALITISTTYMKSFLEMNSSEIGIVFFAVLAAGAPGSKLGEKIALKVNPVKSAILCNIVFIATTTIAAMYLTGPQHKRYVPAVGAVWGLCLGWLHPMHTTSFITLIPRGQEAELMGLYILAGQILSWLPPTLFTALNEAGYDMAFGLASLNTFFLLAIVCLFLIGSFDKALAGDIACDGEEERKPVPSVEEDEMEMSSLEEMSPGVHSPSVIYGSTLPHLS